ALEVRRQLVQVGRQAVRLTRGGRVGDEVREVAQPLQDPDLLGQIQTRGVLRRQRQLGRAQLAGATQDRAAARVRVLHVEDRVVHRLSLGQVQVELQRRV